MARVRLKFFDQTYDLRADDSDVDVREIVEYVQSKVREQETSNETLVPHKKIVLAALNMGKDYVSARHRLKELEKKVVNRTSRLVAKIDSVID